MEHFFKSGLPARNHQFRKMLKESVEYTKNSWLLHMKTPLLLLLLSFLFAFPSHQATAQENVNYSVQAILPEEQHSNASYFDLRVEPGQTVDLQTRIYNDGEEDIEVDVLVTDASTSSNGLIVYEEQEELDPSLEHPLSELIELEDSRITVPANDSVVVTAELTVPDEEFEGIKLGGFRFQKVPEETDEEEGISITNQYAYVIGIVVHQNDEIVEPDLVLNSIQPDLHNHRTAVIVNLQNPEPTIIEDLDIIAEVYEGNSEEPIRTAQQETGRFAPNSNMGFVIDWENQPLEAGTYRVHMTASNEEYEWEWNEEFTIEREETGLNEEAVELDSSSIVIDRLIYIIILLLVIIGFLIYRQYRIKKEK